MRGERGVASETEAGDRDRPHPSLSLSRLSAVVARSLPRLSPLEYAIFGQKTADSFLLRGVPSEPEKQFH